MSTDDVLLLESRRRVYRTLEKHPGLHARELERATGIPLSTLRYHLSYLQKHGLIETREDGPYRRFFATFRVSAEDKPLIALLRRPRPREILLFVLSKPGAEAWHRAIEEQFGYLPSSTLHEHLKLLVDRGVLVRNPVGRETKYVVKDAAQVERVFHAYKESFLEAVAERVIEVIEPDGPPPPDAGSEH